MLLARRGYWAIRSGLIAVALAVPAACLPAGDGPPPAAGRDDPGTPVVAAPGPAGEPRPPRKACGSYRSALSRLLTREQFQCEPDSVDFEERMAELLNRPVDVQRRALFWRACQAHDICYWTLGRSKRECDRGFLDNLVSECDAAFAGYEVEGHCRKSCRADARLYYHFVATSDLAVRSFDEAQGDAARILATVSGQPADAGAAAAVAPALARLIGEGCDRHNAGRCDVAGAAAWVRAQLESASRGTPSE